MTEIPEIPKLKPKSEAAAGLPFWRRLCEAEMLVGITALAIGLCSLFLGFYEAGLQRHHARAAVWPHVEIMLYSSPSIAEIRARNAGIGPARIDDMLVTVDGKPMRSWAELLAKIQDAPPKSYNTSQLIDRVLRPGDEVTLLAVPASDLPADIAKRVGRIGITVLYSSVFDEHWLLEAPVLNAKPRLTPTREARLSPSVDSSF
jgi:hypothetical protein